MNNKLENIFHQYYSPLCNYAAKIIGDEHVAEDLVQALFIKLWENDQLDSIQRLEPFLLKSTKYKCIDYLRAKKRNPEISATEWPDVSTTPDSDLTEEDIEALLYYFAAKLPPRTRTVFLMSRTEGCSYKEIAEELNVSVKTVENQMGSALKKMRTLLKEHNFFSLLFFL